jgi:hypothetical protein
MAEAMEFFGSEYRATGKVYRGTAQLKFDGQPVSYSKRRSVAENFAQWRAGFLGSAYVIERQAPADSLDLQKLLQAYATCRIDFCDESEVILYNTPVPQSQITEFVS